MWDSPGAPNSQSSAPWQSRDHELVDQLAHAAAEDQQKSCWETNGATPMTSRPHIIAASADHQYQLSPCVVQDILHARRESPEKFALLARPRSKSLGSEYERLNGLAPPQLPSMTIGDHLLEPLPKTVTTASFRRQSSTQPEQEQAQKPIHDNPQSVAISAAYGVVNAFIVLPVLMSFASIIYRDPFFSPYMPVLVKLTLVSGIVHQLCFSAFSSLPFAIGQVQDAGLIFLSNMASVLVKAGMEKGNSADEILATVTVSLALCTAVLGCGLVLIGRLRLAQYVRMLPTCIIGGYLAYIGWFCGAAGVSLMAGTSQSAMSLRMVTHHMDKVAPGIAGGMLIYALVRRYRHMAVLPACISFMLGMFYLILLVRGASIEDVTLKGWIRTMDQPPPLARTWDYLRLDLVDWETLPRLVMSELGMIFVVALSSSLDVAAIELELNEPLDYNHELITVGVSNIVSGVTGGYTGSYIFSQSIFSLRAGIRSRAAGVVLAMCQLTVLVLPFSLLQFVPNFFFGSLLSMICIDLMYEWLWDVRKTITTGEYVLSLSTFVLIQVFDVECGILGGVGLYALCWKAGVNVGELKISRPADGTSKYGSIETHVK